jgi:DNA-binding Lrp family transcriptional regulator
MLSDEDALIIDALQLAPRAPWSAVSDLLGISPVTAAKRWQRLADEGIAWVTASPGMVTSSQQCFAYVEITCPANARMAVANAIAAHPLAVTVELITGEADILVTVGGADLPTVTHYVLDHLSEVDSVLNTRLRVATRLYSEGGSWRLRRLPHATAEALVRLHASEIGDEEVSSPIGPMSDDSKAIIEQLSIDGRMSYAELAERINSSPTTVRRRMAWLLRSGLLRLRTDVSAQDAAWPVENYVWADVPVGDLRDTARQLSQMRQARLTATVAAGPQLVQSSWLQTVEEVHRIELAIAEQLPKLQIIERMLVLRTVKRMGRLIGVDGRAKGVVPINIWDDQLCTTATASTPPAQG